MIKKLLFFTMLIAFVGVLGYAAVGAREADEPGTLIFSTGDNGCKLNWDNGDSFSPSVSINYQEGGKLHFVGKINSDNPQLQFAVNGNGWYELEKFFSCSGDTFDHELTSEQAQKLNEGGSQIVVKGQNYTLYSVYYIAPEGGNQGGENPGEGGDQGEVKTVELFSGLDLPVNWDTNDNQYKVFFNHEFKVGDVIIINYEGNPQVKLCINDSWDQLNDVKNESNRLEYEIKSADIAAAISNMLVISGKDYTVKSICYKGTSEDVKVGGTIESASGNVVVGDDVVVVEEQTVIENIDFNVNSWSDEAYKVHFKGNLEVGDQIIIYVTASQLQISYLDKYGEYADIINGDHYLTTENGNYNEHGGKDKFIVNVTAVNKNTLNEGGLLIKGQGVNISKITYKAYGEGKLTASTVFESDMPQDETRMKDLMSRIRDLSFVITHWVDEDTNTPCVTVTPNEDGSVKIKTIHANEGAGVMALLLEDLADAPDRHPLTDAEYNGDGDIYGEFKDQTENDLYGENAKITDPFLQLNRWESINIELSEPVKDANSVRVSVYYRDLHYSNYLDPDIKEISESQWFSKGQNFISVPLDDYRYIRAIAIRSTNAAEITVNKMYLYEREEWKADGQTEIWLPVDTDGNTIYEGVSLGTKQFYDANKYQWQAVEGTNEAWRYAIEMPAESFKGIQTDEKDYNIQHCFAIVYKNAETIKSVWSSDDWAAPGQFQLYINFPFYQTEKEGFDFEGWNIYWESTRPGYDERENGVDEDSWKEQHKMYSYLNERYGEKAPEQAYTPNIRLQHAFRTAEAHKENFEGSYYVTIPQEKHDQYTHALVYINGSQLVTYPVIKEKTGVNGKKKAADNNVTSEGVEEKEGSAIDLIKTYGLAIRGQNANIMKVVYLGDLKNVVDEDITDDWDKVEGGEMTGVEELVEVEGPAVVTVFNMQGMAVRTNVAAENATLGLHPGIYIVNGKKVMVK